MVVLVQTESLITVSLKHFLASDKEIYVGDLLHLTKEMCPNQRRLATSGLCVRFCIKSKQSHRFSYSSPGRFIARTNEKIGSAS